MNKIYRLIVASLLVISMLFGVVGCKNSENTEINGDTKATQTDKGGVAIEKTGFTNLSDEIKSKKGNYQSAESRIADMQIITQDEKQILYLDPEFAEFAVKDKTTGECWFSNPYDFENDSKAGGDTKEELQSLLSLTYFDSSSKEYTMNSYSDCTAKDQYTLEKFSNGFAIHMQIGYAEEKILSPAVISVSKYENLIVKSLSNRDAKKLGAYYIKVSKSDNSISESVLKEYLKEYPGLKENDFYILREATAREQRVIADIIKTTEYTAADMDADLELAGYKSTEKPVALFNISVYVELENGNLKVTVPANEISYNKKAFFLSSFKLLKYFGAGKYTQDGYLFIPDGSGALINYNNDGVKTTLHTTTKVYGMDYALSFDYKLNSLTSQNYFPVFGNKSGNKATLAIIEEGDALATLITESGNILTSYETVYPQFDYETTYTANNMESTKVKGMYTYHDTNRYTGNYTVSYHLLTGSQSDYVGMAKEYRSYLIEKGILKKLDEKDASPAFYIETLGSLEKTSTKFGIPYVESVPLTTFEDTKTIISEINNTADISLRVRYKGWQNGGLYYSISNKAKIEKSLGGKSGLKSLREFADQNNTKLFPDVDFFTVSKDGLFDGYRKSTDSVRNITRNKLYLTIPSALNNLAEFQYLDYSVTPNSFEKYMKSYFSDYKKLEENGISIGTAGTMLYADYNRKQPVNREEAKNIVTGNIKKYASGLEMMADGGNAYVLEYTNELLNVPTYNSAYTLEDESVPFMQIVLHGYVAYSGNALNLSSDYKYQFLRSIEYGSSPLFTVAAKNTDLIKRTSMPYYYSVNWEVLKADIKQCAEDWANAYKGLSSLSIEEHRKLENDVYLTVYENGIGFYVNYSDRDITVDGVSVKAHDYLRVEVQQ